MSNFIDDIIDKRESKSKAKRERTAKAEKATKVVKLTKKEEQILEMSNSTILPDHYKTVWTPSDLNELAEWIKQQEYLAVDTETYGINPHRDRIVGISFYAPHKGYYIPLEHKDNVDYDVDGVVGRDYVRCLPKQLVSDILKPLLTRPNLKLIFHNGKFDLHVIANWLGIRLRCYYDTMIAQGLLDENVSKALKDMAVMYLKIPADKFGTLFGNVTFDKVPVLMKADRSGCLASYYAIKDTELTYRMFEFQMKYLNRPDLAKIKSLLFDVEIPVADIMFKAEQRGVMFDSYYMQNEVSPKLHVELKELKETITKFLGDINLNSPAQLSKVLYDDLKLPQVNKKAPRSTDKKTLTKLINEHEVIPTMLRYRSLEKLVTAFVDKLPEEAINGVIHGSFNNVGTVTGRFSSSNPNLQQIPANVGTLIRSAFIARPGRILVSADFGSQELRWLAHISQDPVLLDIYLNGKDVHSMTGTAIWNMKHEDKVTYDEFQRYREVYSAFRDKDGNVDESKLNDTTFVGNSLKDGIVLTDNIDVIRKEAETGKQMEKYRKKAKTVDC